MIPITKLLLHLSPILPPVQSKMTIQWRWRHPVLLHVSVQSNWLFNEDDDLPLSCISQQFLPSFQSNWLFKEDDHIPFSCMFHQFFHSFSPIDYSMKMTTSRSPAFFGNFFHPSIPFDNSIATKMITSRSLHVSAILPFVQSNRLLNEDDHIPLSCISHQLSHPFSPINYSTNMTTCRFQRPHPNSPQQSIYIWYFIQSSLLLHSWNWSLHRSDLHCIIADRLSFVTPQPRDPHFVCKWRRTVTALQPHTWLILHALLLLRCA